MKRNTFVRVAIYCVLVLAMLIPISTTAESPSVRAERIYIEQKHNVTIQIPASLSEQEALEKLANVDAYLTNNTIEIRFDIESEALSSDEDYDLLRKPGPVTKSGTASVWCGIPSIGHGYIKTPYTVKYTPSGGINTINSCTLSNSYGTGFTIGTFIFYDNWWNGVTSLNVYARGQISYFYDSLNITTDLQTFLDTIDL